MTSANGGVHALVGILKAIVVSLLKVSALVLAFACNLLSVILGKLASVLQKIAGYGQGH